MKLILKRRSVLFCLTFFVLVFIFYIGWFSNSCEYNEKLIPVVLPEVHKPEISLPATYLVILIMSASDDPILRDTIRNTWLKLSNKGTSYIRHLFPIGVQNLTSNQKARLLEEQEQFGDLAILENHTERYENLARKTAFGIQFAVKQFQFKFLLKVDSDSFVRLGALLKSLKDIEHSMLYWGFLDGRARPFRKGKWKEPDWILCDRYLPYQLGGGYVLSYNLAKFISDNIKLLKFYKSEDVSVGAWLAGLDVKYIHDPRFDTEFASRGCNNEYLITHKSLKMVISYGILTSKLRSRFREIGVS
uniref:Hexosyltransferase n=1 Tax=Acrobeloides nanus TaxID=290746 RepID=A0A914E9V7_9BILA